MKKMFIINATALIAGWPIYANSFGTIRIIGQDAEHEHITRRALTCDPNAPLLEAGERLRNCFLGKKTLDKLAGKSNTFGAIGYPDKNLKLFFTPEAHCDSDTYQDKRPSVSKYERDLASAEPTIMKCRVWMQTNFSYAIAASLNMLNPDGSLNEAQVKLDKNCITINRKASSAKCKALTHFGIALHATQDFYSHSNWTDKVDGPYGIHNPIGLGNEAPALILKASFSDPNIIGFEFPENLVTGCYRTIIEGLSCGGHIKHGYLSKDKGMIPISPDEDIKDAKTSRGKNGNFEQAVEVAVQDTRSKLIAFRAALDAKARLPGNHFSQADADLVFCAFTHDDPIENCR